MNKQKKGCLRFREFWIREKSKQN